LRIIPVTLAPQRERQSSMHFLGLVATIWFCFGVVTTLGFLWLGKRGVRALDQCGEKDPPFKPQKKAPVVASSNAA